MLSSKPCASVLAVLVLVLGGHAAALGAEPGEGKFYEAYFLEHADGDVAAAAELYEDVVAARGVDRGIKLQAQARLAACREVLASSDFAKLMPPDTLAYAELKRPGDQVLKLLSNLGLLSDGTQRSPDGGNRIAISPSLIKEILGIRGAAVAVTGFDPFKMVPAGVLVFDPGNLEVLRGLIETGLPIGGKLVEPIEGFATYSVEDQAFVTLTSRLVVASPQRAQIQSVIRRLNGKERDSLATSDTFVEAIQQRDDSLIYFFVNAKPIMPMISAMAAGAGSQNRELAIAQALLDLDSIQSLMGNVGISDDGLFLELSLRLDEGHSNLVYNFFRTPPISRDTLKYVPHDAGAVIVGALNEAASRYTSAPFGAEGQTPVITALDFGREIFANIVGMAVYVLPPDGSGSESGMPIPDVAAAISVHDPDKSEALWAQVLGIATMATGATSMQGSSTNIDGVQVRSYRFPGNVNIYFATMESNVLIASSRSAMERSINAKLSGKSILDDQAFTQSVSNLSPETTKAVFVHAGRCAEIARLFMDPKEIAEMEPFAQVLSNTALSLVVEHSGQTFRVSARITGLPDVGDLVTSLVNEQKALEESRSRLRLATRQGKWDQGLTEVDALLAKQPNSTDLLKTKFEILAVGKKEHQAATDCAELILKNDYDSADALNGFAWALLTEDQYGDQYSEVALKFSERSNEITGRKNWAYVDTLALAAFKTGDAESAVALEEKAIELSQGKVGKQSKAALETALARFQAAQGETELASGNDPPGSE